MDDAVLSGSADIRSCAAWRDQLCAALEQRAEEVAIDAAAAPDMAALQLVVSAVAAARAEGRTLRIAMEEGSPAALLWARLAFDALPETCLRPPAARPATPALAGP
ncbi:STAS domain-containing protein [Poseidonocella sp. HB161398]|uniref:STAS domain-containing protein n=1 Tax=Poseidonocella sp. HB161398 TaxID=2320855 RepID=UPI0014860A0F|nr:STAS domain-containing protein [Poseidonocella sp. HB161398]